MSKALPEPPSLPWKLKPDSSAESGSETLADGRRRFWIKEELTTKAHNDQTYPYSREPNISR